MLVHDAASGERLPHSSAASRQRAGHGRFGRRHAGHHALFAKQGRISRHAVGCGRRFAAPLVRRARPRRGDHQRRLSSRRPRRRARFVGQQEKPALEMGLNVADACSRCGRDARFAAPSGRPCSPPDGSRMLAFGGSQARLLTANKGELERTFSPTARCWRPISRRLARLRRHVQLRRRREALVGRSGTMPTMAESCCGMVRPHTTATGFAAVNFVAFAPQGNGRGQRHCSPRETTARPGCGDSRAREATPLADARRPPGPRSLGGVLARWQARLSPPAKTELPGCATPPPGSRRACSAAYCKHDEMVLCSPRFRRTEVGHHGLRRQQRLCLGSFARRGRQDQSRAPRTHGGGHQRRHFARRPPRRHRQPGRHRQAVGSGKRQGDVQPQAAHGGADRAFTSAPDGGSILTSSLDQTALVWPAIKIGPSIKFSSARLQISRQAGKHSSIRQARIYDPDASEIWRAARSPCRSRRGNPSATAGLESAAMLKVRPTGKLLAAGGRSIAKQLRKLASRTCISIH